jgi:hypothetical protein
VEKYAKASITYNCTQTKKYLVINQKKNINVYFVIKNNIAINNYLSLDFKNLREIIHETIKNKKLSAIIIWCNAHISKNNSIFLLKQNDGTIYVYKNNKWEIEKYNKNYL